MANITAAMVKELRERTSAGMMDCKKALEESDGSMEAAIDWLRQKGLSKAAKKAGRATSEGLIGCEIFDNGKKAVLLAVGCETDFVARGEKFVAFVKEVTSAFAASGKDTFAEDDVRDSLNQAIVTLGENITIGQNALVQLSGHGLLGHYVHSNGKIGVLVEVNCTQAATVAKPEFAALVKDMALHIAAATPLALTAQSIDPAILDREREVYRQKAQEDGKPENIIEKIVEGAVNKYFKEVCLLEQGYIRDDKLTITAVLQQKGKELGDTLSVRGFTRIQLGVE